MYRPRGGEVLKFIMSLPTEPIILLTRLMSILEAKLLVKLNRLVVAPMLEELPVAKRLLKLLKALMGLVFILLNAFMELGVRPLNALLGLKAEL